MTTPIHLDRKAASPAGKHTDGCCGGHVRAEGESHPKDEGCCGGSARSEPGTEHEHGGCCGGQGHGRQ